MPAGQGSPTSKPGGNALLDTIAGGEGARAEVSGAVRRIEVTGRARPDVAWERYADLSAWPSWACQIRAVGADGPRLALGRSGVVHVVGGLRVPFAVTAVDECALTWS